MRFCTRGQNDRGNSSDAEEGKKRERRCEGHEARGDNGTWPTVVTWKAKGVKKSIEKDRLQ